MCSVAEHEEIHAMTGSLKLCARKVQTFLLQEIDLMISGQRCTFEDRDGVSVDVTGQALNDMVALANELESVLSRLEC